MKYFIILLCISLMFVACSSKTDKKLEKISAKYRAEHKKLCRASDSLQIVQTVLESEYKTISGDTLKLSKKEKQYHAKVLSALARRIDDVKTWAIVLSFSFESNRTMYETELLLAKF